MKTVKAIKILNATIKQLQSEVMELKQKMARFTTEEGDLDPKLKSLVEDTVKLLKEMKKERWALEQEKDRIETQLKKIQKKYDSLTPELKKKYPALSERNIKGLKAAQKQIEKIIDEAGEENEIWTGIIEDVSITLSKLPSQRLSYKGLWEHALEKVNKATRKVLKDIKEGYRNFIAKFSVATDSLEKAILKEMKSSSKRREAGMFDFIKSLYKRVKGWASKLLDSLRTTNDAYRNLEKLLKETKKEI